MELDIALVVLGGALLVIGLVSNALKRVWLSPPLAALVLGVLLGPEVLNVFIPTEVGDSPKLLEEIARIALSVSLVATGLQITRGDLRTNLRRTSMLIAVAMAGMWALTSVGAYLILDVEWWIALLIGAVLTPTDPVVASSIVEGPLAGENLPRWLCRTLQMESGSNDGLALAFVLVPALVLTTSDGATGIGLEIAKELGIALGVGLLAGVLIGRIVLAIEAEEQASAGFFSISALAMGLAVLGGAHALGGTGILGSFVAGVTFAVVVGEDHVADFHDVQNSLERLVITPTFIFFGAILPWDDWKTLGATGLLFAAWVLVVRRPAPVVAALSPTDTPRRGVAFLGWFGPLGVAGMYYAAYAAELGIAEGDEIFAATTLAITASVVAHGITATPGVRRYAGRRATTTLRHPLRPGVGSAP